MNESFVNKKNNNHENAIEIPSRIPTKPNLNGVPLEVIQSTTVNQLISHNEDLSARLSVSLRRINELENGIHEKQTELEAFKQRYQNLKDQLFIIKEKSHLLFERKQQEQSDFTKLKNELELLNIKYSQLYKDSHDKIRVLETGFQKINTKLTKTLKLKNVFKATAKRLKTELANSLKIQKTLEFKFEKLQKVNKEIAHNLNTQLNESRTESEKIIQALTIKHEEQINEFESNKVEIQQKLLEYKNENQKLLQQNKNFQGLFEQNVQLKNETIRLKRTTEEINTSFKVKTHELELSNQSLRNENKNLASKNLQLEEEGKTHLREFKLLEVNFNSITDHNQNLELFWKKAQDELEQLKQQNSSLKKLNKNLSQHLSQTRSDYKSLHTQLELIRLKQNLTPPKITPDSKDKTQKTIETIIEDLDMSFNGSLSKDL